MTTPDSVARAGRRGLRSLFYAACLAVVLTVAAQAGQAPSFQEIEESLTCQCGCGLTVHSCNHLQCPSALPLRAEIREQLAAEKNKDEILGYFRDKYGEKVLSSPTTSGFNLLAWVTPFIVVSIGGLLLIGITRRWYRRPAAASPDSTAPSPAKPQDDALREILDREMKDFDR